MAHCAALTGWSPERLHHLYLTIPEGLMKRLASQGQTRGDTICDYWFAQPWHGKWQRIDPFCWWRKNQFVAFGSLPVIHSFLCMTSPFGLSTLSYHYWISLIIHDLVTLFFTFSWTPLYNTACAPQQRSGHFLSTMVEMDWGHLIYTNLRWTIALLCDSTVEFYRLCLITYSPCSFQKTGTRHIITHKSTKYTFFC